MSEQPGRQPMGIPPKPAGGYLLEDFVMLAIEELQRRAPPAEYVTREWLDQMRGLIAGVLADLSLVVPEAMPELTRQGQETFCKLLEETVRQSWEITEKQLRPKAWVEKFYAAETDEDRRRIFYWALKNHCLDLKRKQRVEGRLFTSLDELQERAEQAAEDPGRKAPRLPSTADNPELGLLKEKLHQALLGLPIQLAVIAYLMPGAEGNASKLGRYLDIPSGRWPAIWTASASTSASTA
ncbi:MAG: hypothetical protein M0D55_09575 [Elusimicrobiota bacterium]|nr:MAG: hypothetical protein M0D55_09575 [Elusimicrobiota bacterium]